MCREMQQGTFVQRLDAFYILVLVSWKPTNKLGTLFTPWEFLPIV